MVVVKRIMGNHEELFWTGSGWSNEFPDALEVGIREAQHIAKRALRAAGDEDFDVYAVINYGENSEKELDLI